MPIRWHEEDPALLTVAIRFTAFEMGLDPRLVEKDYFCSVLLEYLGAADPGLVFKGGTCLTKVHFGFYRLSEDLDFSIPVESGSGRGERSRGTAKLKAAVAEIEAPLPAFRVIEAVRGANNSTQYSGVVAYTSLLDRHHERVSIEVGLREPVLAETLAGEARTALLDPVTGLPLVAVYRITCLSFKKAMAEKVRAALCRRQVAIRDFFDVDYAIQRCGFDPRDEAFLGLLRRKLEVPGTDRPDVSRDRTERLRLHPARLSSQRVPGGEQRRPRPLRVDHQPLGAFRGVEARHREKQGPPRRRGPARRDAREGAAARSGRELHPVRRQPGRRYPQDRGQESPGARGQQRRRLGGMAGGAQAAVPPIRASHRVSSETTGAGGGGGSRRRARRRVGAGANLTDGRCGGRRASVGEAGSPRPGSPRRVLAHPGQREVLLDGLLRRKGAPGRARQLHVSADDRPRRSRRPDLAHLRRLRCS